MNSGSNLIKMSTDPIIIVMSAMWILGLLQ